MSKLKEIVVRGWTLGLILSLASATGVASAQSGDWQRSATASDRARIEGLPGSWETGLREASASDPEAVVALGVLARPEAALSDARPPAGAYRCRTIKLGKVDETLPAYIAYVFFRCRIDRSTRGDLMLTKITGSQRPKGRLYPRSNKQLVFLGTEALGIEETTWPRYGDQQDRDIAGVFERIGPKWYRLVMPSPFYESELDILELVKMDRARRR